MASPMEYDVLREMYSSAMAALTRLEIKYGIDTEQFKSNRKQFVDIWLEDVKRKNVEDINYQAAAQKMKDAAKPWTDLGREL